MRLIRRRQADIVEERVPHRNRLALALTHQHPQVPDAGSSTQAINVALRLELIDVHNHAAAVVGTQRKELTRRAVHAGKHAQPGQRVAHRLAQESG